MSEKTLRICHLYPDLLNLYGDRGNILCMRRRLEWRGIGAEVTEVTVGQQADFTQFDLFFIGGGQDFEQEVLLSDLKAGKGDEIKAAIADGKTFLTICGGYQMLGKQIADPHGVETGGVIRGMGLLPVTTELGEQKVRTRVGGEILGGMLDGCELSGYEIHMGISRPEGDCLSLIHI